eukprot:COSAG01_NODE_1147_length_11515_cov_38.979694_10_plen_145_part_00
MQSSIGAVMKYFMLKMAEVNGSLIPVSQAVPTKCLEFLGERLEHDHEAIDDDEAFDDDDEAIDDDGGGYEPEFVPPKALPPQDSQQLMDVADVRAHRLCDVMGVTAADARALKSIPELYHFAMAYWYGFNSAYLHTQSHHCFCI